MIVVFCYLGAFWYDNFMLWISHASCRCLQLGKVMGARYPDQVGGHKPCEPEFGYVHMSPFGTVFVLPRRWLLVPLVGTGPPMT